MIRKIANLLGSPIATILLLLLYSGWLAVATWFEKDYGSDLTKTFFYYSPIVIVLYLLLVSNFLLVTIKRWQDEKSSSRKKWLSKELAYTAIHFSFIIILSGATYTHLWSKEGLVHIREGERTNAYLVTSESEHYMEELPFTLELLDFRLIRYPGSHSPASYESDLQILFPSGEVRQAEIYMNNVLDLSGYRFYQASYDEDELGTILSVSDDLVGTAITYTGYTLLMIGFLLMFLLPDSYFRRLWRSLRRVQKRLSHLAPLLILILTPPPSLQASPSITPEMMARITDPTLIPDQVSSSFGQMPVQWQGRVVPLNTLSTQLVRKLTGSHRIGQLSADQFLLSYLAMPEVWMQIPLINIEDQEIADRFLFDVGANALSTFFDVQGRYKLSIPLEKIYQKAPQERTKREKELLKIDEKVNILYALYEGDLVQLFPDPKDTSNRWYALANREESPSQIEGELYISYLHTTRQAIISGQWNKAEVLLKEVKKAQIKNDSAGLIVPDKIAAEYWYNNSNVFAKCRVAYFILGGLLLLLSFVEITKGERRGIKITGRVILVAIILVMMVHIFGMGLRWYISGYAPWSNSYETMIYVALATVVGGLIIGRKNQFTLALSTLFAGVILFVAGLSWMDPQITTLVPVLRSPWLMFHVAVIIAAYGFFGIGLLLGLSNLLIPLVTHPTERTTLMLKELSIINQLSLLVGLALMTIGTFLGAIWANESWGRYWGWDPKETWALITIVIYTIVTHIHLTKWGHTPWWHSLLSVLAFYSVIMTYFGVNMYLSGMHSYGNTENVAHFTFYILLSLIIILVIAIPSYFSYRKKWHNNKHTTV